MPLNPEQPAECCHNRCIVSQPTTPKCRDDLIPDNTDTAKNKDIRQELTECNSYNLHFFPSFSVILFTTSNVLYMVILAKAGQ